MSVLTTFFLITCILGILGGIVNAFLSDNGFLLPKTEPLPNGQTIWRPGLIGNIIVGLAGALVISLLNTDFDLLTEIASNSAMKAFAAALLAGVGGARILSNEVDKNLLRAAVQEGTAANASPNVANMADATPADLLRITSNLDGPAPQ